MSYDKDESTNYHFVKSQDYMGTTVVSKTNTLIWKQKTLKQGKDKRKQTSGSHDQS